VRCPACGARNSATASWCTQCYAALHAGAGSAPADGEERGAPIAGTPPVQPTEPRTEPPTEPRTEPRTEPPTEPPATGTPVDRGGTTVARDVRERDGEVEWRCGRCAAWSPLLVSACTTCGGSRHGFGGPAADRPGREVSPAATTGLSVVLPGAGHLLAGRPGTGGARLVLWALWLLGGLSIVRGAGGARVAMPGLVLLVGAAILWAGTLVDVRRLTAGDDRELLAPRPLLWLVGAVIVAVVVAALAAAVLAG
jgi:hypothetical protein